VSAPRKQSRCLGLIGGLGPAATVFYYRALIAGLEKHDRVPRLLLAHADIGRVYEIFSAKDYDGLARYLASLIEQIAAGGAEFSAIVAATPHICAPQLAKLSPLPLIDMIDAVADALREKKLQRVALLGTRFTVETKMFGRLGGVDVIMPKPGEIDRVHAIYTEVVAGRGTAALLDELKNLAHLFLERGAQAVLIAGTDLSPLLAESDVGVPVLDCARIHIDAIVRRMAD
jgi:aspartate racemase